MRQLGGSPAESTIRFSTAMAIDTCRCVSIKEGM